MNVDQSCCLADPANSPQDGLTTRGIQPRAPNLLCPPHPGRLAYLSGPSFAAEVAREIPTAVTIASESDDVAHRTQQLLSSARFRCYRTTDVIGVLGLVGFRLGGGGMRGRWGCWGGRAEGAQGMFVASLRPCLLRPVFANGSLQCC